MDKKKRNAQALDLRSLEKTSVAKLKNIELKKILGGDCSGCKTIPSAVGVYVGKPGVDDPD